MTTRAYRGRMGADSSRSSGAAASSNRLRVAMLSMHTSPLAQPGHGDAGGMNVYIANAARALSQLGVHVDCYTLDTSVGDGLIAHTEGASVPATTEPRLPAGANSVRTTTVDGLTVNSIRLPAAAGATKEDLPSFIELWADAVAAHMMADAANLGDESTVILHSHYWLSGIAGLRIGNAARIPLVHTMHTIGAVKNARRLIAGDATNTAAEPQARIDAERELAQAADHLTANTAAEREELAEFCGADAARVSVVTPGVDPTVFNPGDRAAARSKFAMARGDFVVAFVGRLQPHKGPDLAIAAVADLLIRQPQLRDRTHLLICGGASGTTGFTRSDLAAAAAAAGIGGSTTFIDPLPPAELADLYRASDVLLVPSISESFGLVAMEAQACGTPVVASAEGGLLAAVADGRSGCLVTSRQPADWSTAIGGLVDPLVWQKMSAAAVAHAAQFTWRNTAIQLLEIYEHLQS